MSVIAANAGCANMLAATAHAIICFAILILMEVSRGLIGQHLNDRDRAARSDRARRNAVLNLQLARELPAGEADIVLALLAERGGVHRRVAAVARGGRVDVRQGAQALNHVPDDVARRVGSAAVEL